MRTFRFFATRPVTMVLNVFASTAVSAERITNNPEDAHKMGHMYYVNDSTFGDFNCKVYDHIHPVGVPLLDKSDALLFPSTIWGPTCDSEDLIEENKMMRVMEVGEWMVYPDMGAYTLVGASPFNGFQLPQRFYVASEDTW